MPFIKTSVGRNELIDEATRLTARERQIVLLCTGTRPTERLVDIFGPEVLDDLKELEQRGLVRLLELVPAGADAPSLDATPVAAPGAVVPPAAAPMAPELSGESWGAHAWLMAARGAALAVLEQVGPSDDEVRYLIESYQDAESENDVLMLVAQTTRVTLCLAGKKAAAKVSMGLGYLLPDTAIPSLLDCMLESSDPELVGWLYERLLAGSDNTLADARAV
ncbi:hypothetical protein [Ottowia testudinis]|uniref:Uncharacterized protein n=1 Tax=Ottowia testudinis TaxID=2816950 RepID=A0A975CJI5_9BURK|nr:hypothetical protein [Ottowia testudinis]QTD46749.1 hypothetical protein J1M35_07725 [Ottowia testudinis]